MTRPGRAHRADDLARGHGIAGGHARLGEVVVEREQAETVVHHDVAPGEEVLGDERRAAGVRREDGRPGRRGPVVAGMRASRLAVDELAKPEAPRRLATLHRRCGTARARDAPGSPSASAALSSPRSLSTRASVAASRSTISFGSVSCRVGNVRARTSTTPAASAPPFFAALGRVTRQATGPGRTSRSIPTSAAQPLPAGNSASGRPSHSARTSGGTPVSCRRSTSPGCALGGVTDTRTPPGDPVRDGGRRGREAQERGTDQEGAAPHSGVGPGGCWRRNRSISATRSFASGKSAAGGASASSVS